MKYTLLLTQQCNLRCSYCYIGKKPETMSLETANAAVDFIFRHQIPEEDINIGFFGGEPLLEFELMQDVMELITNHPDYDPTRLKFSVVTNGTLYNDIIAGYLKDHKIGLVISCDGKPDVHDRFRKFPDGNKSSHIVEENIRSALQDLGQIPINAVYHPSTLKELPENVQYFSDLGIRQIYLSPDFSADWLQADIDILQGIYDRIGKFFVSKYLAGDPHFISLIDSKLTVILRGGYQARERCRMGKGEMAFTPAGKIYPCERLIGSGENGHCIGDLTQGLELDKMSCHLAEGKEKNQECTECHVRDYCMNWCGCSNFQSTGFYNRVSAFLCASEKAAMKTSLEAIKSIERDGDPAFIKHFTGYPMSNSIKV
jgi:uncharacterized protein